MPVNRRTHDVAWGAAWIRVTVADRASVAQSISDQALRLSDEVVLEVGPHLHCEASSVLVEELARDEREEVKLFFLLLLAFLLSLKLVVEHFLVVEEEELILQNL